MGAVANPLPTLEEKAGEMASEATRKEEYQEYLASPEWQTRRKAALQRAESRCQVCYSQKRLEVHHRTYARVEEERDSDLTVLCRRCHELFHGKRKLASSKPTAKANPKHVQQARQIKRRRKRQRRAAKRYAERPTTFERRQQLASEALREQRREEAG